MSKVLIEKRNYKYGVYLTNLFFMCALLFGFFTKSFSQEISSTNDEMALFGFEYTPIIPKAAAGFRFILARKNPNTWMGFYLQCILDVPVDDKYAYDNLTKNPFGDQVKGTEINFVGVSAGTVYPINDIFAITGGLGLSSTNTFKILYDNTGILGDQGTYYTPDENKTAPYFQFGGITLINKTIILGLSADVPLGISISIGYNFLAL